MLCGSCTNTDVCKWLEKPVEFKENTPGRPILDAIAGDKEIILYWERPSDGNSPITKYVILVYESDDTSKGINIEFASDPKCTSCSHIVKNLENNKFYSFGVTAVNKIGMSKLSNVVKKMPQAKSVVETNESFQDYKIFSETKTYDDEDELNFGNEKKYDNMIIWLIKRYITLQVYN